MGLQVCKSVKTPVCKYTDVEVQMSPVGFRLCNIQGCLDFHWCYIYIMKYTLQIIT